jgi:SAM-dependent methyltransferase
VSGEAYGPDLAYVHDKGYGDFARVAGPGLLRLLSRAGIHEGLVVDLGCGSGIWARTLVDAGFDVLGVDLSPDMLRIARRRAPTARFVCSSFLDAELPPCVAVTAMGECLSYAFDPRAGRKSLLPLFRRIRRAVRPGGMLIFDVAEPGREQGRTPRRTWRDEVDWTLCLEAAEDSHELVLTRRITLFRKAGRLYRRSDELHTLALYRRGELLEDLTSAGFDARVLTGYGKLRFPRGLVGFAATRPR